CEEELQRSVPEIAARYRRQLKARISAANNFKPMCDALNMARASPLSCYIFLLNAKRCENTGNCSLKDRIEMTKLPKFSVALLHP
ncbi:hypothetical protein MJM99_31830, partial [Salmonella enterica subsp. enterica serovar Kentucky]|nr:hypothetical protein [Salmonella enterica subsp. enterica serovar Kentucky]